MSYWLGGFDDEWAREKPALVALLAAVEDAFARGDKRVDLGGGTQGYKLRFSDGQDELQWTSLAPRTARAPLDWVRLAPWRARGALARSTSDQRAALRQRFSSGSRDGEAAPERPAHGGQDEQSARDGVVARPHRTRPRPPGAASQPAGHAVHRRHEVGLEPAVRDADAVAVRGAGGPPERDGVPSRRKIDSGGERQRERAVEARVHVDQAPPVRARRGTGAGRAPSSPPRQAGTGTLRSARPLVRRSPPGC